MFILIPPTIYSPYRTFPTGQRPVYYNPRSPIISNPGYVYSPYPTISPYQNYGNYSAYPNYNVYNPYPSYPSYSNFAYNPIYYGGYNNGYYNNGYNNGYYNNGYNNGYYNNGYNNGYCNNGYNNGYYNNGYNNGYGTTTCYLSPLATFTSSLITNPIRDTGLSPTPAQACAPQPYCCPPTYIVNNYYNTPRQSFSHVNSPVTSIPFMGIGGDHDRQPNQGPTFPPFTS